MSNALGTHTAQVMANASTKNVETGQRLITKS
jgi:hypothetical protein